MKAPTPSRASWRWPLLLAAALPLAATAQTAPPDSVATYKHQLGLTASPVLDGFFKNNRSLPLGLLYKRQTKPNQALRARVELLYRYFQKVAPMAAQGTFTDNETRQTDYRIEAAVGKEYMLLMSSRFSIYAGLEAGAFYAPSIERFENYNAGYQLSPDGQITVITAVERGKRSFNTRGFFVQPLAGLRYGLHRRLYVEAEATVPITWSRTKFYSQSSITDFATGTMQLGQSKGDNTFNRLGVNLRPVSALHLVVLF